MEYGNFKSQWVTCDGGPLMLIEEKHLSAWEGSNEPSEGRHIQAQFRWNHEGAATDYDRACDVNEWLGLIDVGEGQGLILGGDELNTTWLLLHDGGMLVRWIYAENETDIINAAKSLSNEISNEEIYMSVGNSNLILLAACEAGDENIYPRLRVSLSHGKYAISTATFEDELTSVLCHKFTRVSELES